VFRLYGETLLLSKKTGKGESGMRKDGNIINGMDDWESTLDNIDWKEVLQEIDSALLDNLAAELGFRSYELLKRASRMLTPDYYLIHLSDGRWGLWSPTHYKHQDPIFAHSREEMFALIQDGFQLPDEEAVQYVQETLDSVRQMQRCIQCGFEFDPGDPLREEWGMESGVEAPEQFCSPECAMESVVKQMQQDHGWE
jgi:rubredoxin